MGMDYNSVVVFGSSSETAFQKLPKELREELEENLESEELSWLRLFTNYDGEFECFGLEISNHSYDESSPTPLKLESKLLDTAKSWFEKYKIKAEFLHYVHVW